MKNSFHRPLFLLIAVSLGSLDLFAQSATERVTQSEKQSSSIQLTESQKRKMESIKVEAEKEAAPLALHLAQVVKRIYENMLSDQSDEKLRAQLSQEMKQATWELLDIKGRSIRESVNLLTDEQKKLLREQMPNSPDLSDLTELIQRLFIPAVPK